MNLKSRLLNEAAISIWYYRARYYDSVSGRFASEDPIGFNGEFNFYLYAHGNPTNLSDPTGLKIRICSRGGWQDLFPFGGIGNHVYLVDTRTNQNCGRGDNSGKENPLSLGTSCIDVPDSDGHEDEIMSCCKAKHDKPGQFMFFKNDCHTLVKECVKKAGIPVPTIPGGRWGNRCPGADCRWGPWKEDIGWWSSVIQGSIP